MSCIRKCFHGSIRKSVVEFNTLDTFNTAGFIVGCENGDRYNQSLVKSFVLILDTRKNKLYGNQSLVAVALVL